jgi:putative phosphoribosyl transferase
MFHNRKDAGQVLAEAIGRLPAFANGIVLGLPRGGVPVAFEIARALRLSLDILAVRKLGAPGQEELALGAVASGGGVVLNFALLRSLDISEEMLQPMIQQELREIERREQLYREGRPAPDLRGHTVLLVDDGLATGASMRAAVKAVRPVAQQVIVAVPVGSGHTCRKLGSEVDHIVCTKTPETFYAVGQFYRDFRPTTDEEVQTLLSRARREWQPKHQAA